MNKKLVFISVDGLRPSDYLDPRSVLKSLRLLMQRGAFAESLEPIYPTVTFSNHASLVTGVYSDRHGIYANTHFDPDRVTEWIGGESQDWIMDAKRYQVPCLWEEARKLGLRTAALRWPMTFGAQIDFLIPEVFPVFPRDPQSVWQMIADSSHPEFLAEVFRRRDAISSSSHGDLDDATIEAALMVLGQDLADLILIHLTELDHDLHEFGLSSPACEESRKRTDARLTRILDEVDLSRDCVLVAGDHGFTDIDRRINLNGLLADHGFITAREGRIMDWTAIAQNNCAQAPVYLRNPGHDPGREKDLLQLLWEHAPGHYQVLENEALRELRAFPHALCAIDLLPGFGLGSRLSASPLVEELPEPRGEHGYLPSYASMKTGCIWAGPRISPGTQMGHARLIDIAPTIADVLGFRLPKADGCTILN